MTEDQFCAWIIFALPLLMILSKPLCIELIIAFILGSIFPVVLLIIAENTFIEDCKKGYKDWEESIFPQFFYKKWKKELKE